MELSLLLTRLCTAPGVSGRERALHDRLIELAPTCASVERDAASNLTLTLEPSGTANRTVTLCAHADRIGFVVTDFCENGFLRVAPVGGIDPRTLPASRVTVYGRETLTGIFATVPPHLQREEDEKVYPEVDRSAIDIGLSLQQAQALVSRGDFVTLQETPAALSEHAFLAPALDNRAGCAVLLAVADRFAENPPKSTRLVLLFSAQEELGCRGARVNRAAAASDAVIAVDTSFSSFPGTPPEKTGTPGAGPMLGISPILSEDLTHTLQTLARQQQLPIQSEILPGLTGTDADVLTLFPGGEACALLSLPLKNMHSAAEIADLRDIAACVRLLEAYLQKEDLA